MPRKMRIACVMAVGLLSLPGLADARWYYPRGYGGYGWGGWGGGGGGFGGGGAVDPAGGYMAGLGSFARGQGVYEVEHAQAQSINFDTMTKWNTALRARQAELQKQKEQEDAKFRAQRDARVERMELEDGTTLNNLLMQISDFDPNAGRSSRSRAPIGGSAIRDIPFEWNTEAITVCIDQMAGRDALPPALADDRFVEDRARLGRAVGAALKEDAKGDVSGKTMKNLTDAIASFRADFAKAIPKDVSGFAEGDAYFNTLASLARLLHDPSMKKALGELENDREISVGELIAFMQTYNLRFGAVVSSRQLQIYRELVTLLGGVLTDVNVAAVPRPPAVGTQDGKALQGAAQNAFQGMGWPQLEAHANAPDVNRP
jgi:hypothetical protein